jgi:hypothetical protein
MAACKGIKRVEGKSQIGMEQQQLHSTLTHCLHNIIFEHAFLYDL